MRPLCLRPVAPTQIHRACSGPDILMSDCAHLLELLVGLVEIACGLIARKRSCMQRPKGHLARMDGDLPHGTIEQICSNDP